MSEKPKRSGVYKITCINNDKVYIGKAVDIDKRLRDHRNSKKDGQGNGLFQNAILKHGWDSFIVEILEVIQEFDKSKDNQTLLEREAYYIELFDTTNRDKGYNRCKFSNDNTGIIFSKEVREKMSRSKLGKKLSQEHIEKIREANIGRTLSEEHKEKLRKPKSEEAKEKLRKPKSEEAKENMRKARLNSPLSEESREKIRQSLIGKKMSEESKEKMRQAKLGTKHSKETKEKMSLSHKKSNQNINV